MRRRMPQEAPAPGDEKKALGEKAAGEKAGTDKQAEDKTGQS